MAEFPPKRGEPVFSINRTRLHFYRLLFYIPKFGLIGLLFFILWLIPFLIQTRGLYAGLALIPFIPLISASLYFIIIPASKGQEFIHLYQDGIEFRNLFIKGFSNSYFTQWFVPYEFLTITPKCFLYIKYFYIQDSRIRGAEIIPPDNAEEIFPKIKEQIGEDKWSEVFQEYPSMGSRSSMGYMKNMMEKGRLVISTRTKHRRYRAYISWIAVCGLHWTWVPFVTYIIYITGGKNLCYFGYLAIFAFFPIWASMHITPDHRPVKLYEKGFTVAKGLSPPPQNEIEGIDDGMDLYFKYEMIGYLRTRYKLKHGVSRKKVIIKENLLGVKILHDRYDKLVGGEDTFRYPLSREMHEGLVKIMGEVKVEELFRKENPSFDFFRSVNWDEVKKGCEEYEMEKTIPQHIMRNFKHEMVKLVLYLTIPIFFYINYHFSPVQFIFLCGICYALITVFLPPTFQRSLWMKNAVFVLTWGLVFQDTVKERIVPENFTVLGKNPTLVSDYERNEFWVELN